MLINFFILLRRDWSDYMGKFRPGKAGSRQYNRGIPAERDSISSRSTGIALEHVFFWVLFVEIHRTYGIKYVLVSRPRIMIRHICSISVYILELVTRTFIFIGANGIFHILSLKNVFSGPILYLVSFLLKCCYK